MKRLFNLFLITLLLVSCQEKEPIRVACVGDSITFGSTIMNKEENSYPVLLDKMLGEDYQVQNFGMSGRTMLFNPAEAYIKTQHYKDMLEFKPDVVLICLGTNDSKITYRDIASEYEADYNSMIDSISTALPDSRIILMTPPKAHNDITKFKIDAKYITESIVPSVEKVAFDNNLEIIDLHPIFADYVDYLMPDKVHPSAMGAALMVNRIHDYLTRPEVKYTFDATLSNPINFHGFNSYEFEFDGKMAKVAVPKKVAPGHPWLWRARFWGVASAVDEELLEKGFHIVYTDISDMFGSDKAVAQWERFYDYFTSKGLNKKGALEGMSRGGLMVYNFAAKNPEKVSVVYADAPVLDIKSWPFNNPKYAAITEKFLAAYDFKDKDEANEYNRYPMNNAEKIAKAGFDMIHVCGNADDVVPISLNTLPFIEKVRAAGGNILYIEKDGIGHHPHGLDNPAEVVKQILISTGQYHHPTLIPTPGNEYRTGYDWHSVSEEITEFTTNNKYDILLLGNSITQGFGSDRKLAKNKQGKAAMDEAFPNHTWFTAGINGDRTQHLLYRILNGKYETCEPQYVTLTIGINNLNSGGDSAEETIEGIIKCVEAAQEKMPNSKILLFGTLPAQKHMAKCLQISEALSNYAWNENVQYIDPFPAFAPDKENVIEELYAKDLLHLSVKGYEAWVNVMKDYIK